MDVLLFCQILEAAIQGDHDDLVVAAAQPRSGMSKTDYIDNAVAHHYFPPSPAQVGAICARHKILASVHGHLTGGIRPRAKVTKAQIIPGTAMKGDIENAKRPPFFFNAERVNIRCA